MGSEKASIFTGKIFKMKKAGVVVFPGSNCDQDLVEALERSGFAVTRLWHKQADLEGAEAVFLPGGFSYGDYLRSGAIARFSPIMQEVARFAQQGGFVMGICNGFQILTEAGLLPGALLRNTNRLFICDYVWLKPEAPTASFFQIDSGKPLHIPIAHGEGRYFAPEDQLAELEANGQVLFRYCQPDGQVSEAANPNGSVSQIAGVRNKQGNVMGMMPHPERVADIRLGSTVGLSLFKGIYQQI